MMNYSELKRAGKLYGTIKRAKALRSERATLRATSTPTAVQILPLGPIDSAAAQLKGEEYRPKIRNWLDPRPVRDQGGIKTTQAYPYKGRYSNYPKDEHTVCVHSVALASAQHILAFVGKERIKTKAPMGCKYGRDALGIYVVRTKYSHKDNYRYHLNSDEIRGTSKVRAALKTHEGLQKIADKARKEQEGLMAMGERLVKQGLVFLRLEDSLQSGNCRTGTMEFAKRHGLDIKRAYNLKAMRRIKAGASTAQFERACNSAIVRSVEDMGRGYCNI